MRTIDLGGQRYGRLTAISKVIEDSRLVRWNCVCDCGKSSVVKTKYLRNGGTKSCGCIHIEESLKKVMSREKPIGFERVTSKGYVEIKTSDGFKRKHVYVMESAIGRNLFPNEVVHHIDENKKNNAIENLQIMTHAEHTIHHNKKGKRHA